MTLALDYRPVRLQEVVGQRHIAPILRAMVRAQNVPSALLYTGSRGTGKTSTGRAFAAALNCEAPDEGDCCAECSTCKAIQAGNHTTVLEIDAASNGTVDEIRKVKELVQYRHEGDYYVVMLDEVHSMSTAAFNALLKVLEEPPDQTVFILLTTEPQKIPETVVSRSMGFEFRRLMVPDIVARLVKIAKEQKIKVSGELLTEIAVRAQGGMRDAVMALDQVSRVGISDVEGFRDLFGYLDVSSQLMAAAIEADYTKGCDVIEDYFSRVGDARQMVADLTSLVRDLIVLRSGGEVSFVNEKTRKEREAFAQSVSIERLVGVIKVLWELSKQARYVENDQRAAMEMGFVLVADALQVREVPIPTMNASGQTVAAPERRVTLDEIRQTLEAGSRG